MKAKKKRARKRTLRPKYLYRWIRRAELIAYDERNRPVRIVTMRRYKKPVTMNIMMERNPEKQVLWYSWNNRFGAIQLVRYMNRPEKLWLMTNEGYWLLEEHDIQRLTGILLLWCLDSFYYHIKEKETSPVFRFPKALWKKWKEWLADLAQ